jgi:iron complex transport system substrate-binding protein
MSEGGNGHHTSITFHHPPQRVVSLVPSMTESMFDLGLGSALIGITDFCIHPAEDVKNLPRLGGPKNPRAGEIIDLEPDLVLANWEENTRELVETLEAANLKVWVTFPRSVHGSLDVLWTMASLFQSQMARVRIQTLELTLDWAMSAASERPSQSFFCPIWYETASDGQQWWMTFNQGTYSNDLLKCLGGENIFADRARRYPLAADLGQQEAQDPDGRDTRYPCVTLAEIRSAQPQAVLLPSEPFAFNEAHRSMLLEMLADTPAGRGGAVHLVDGTLITWHGTRLAHALRELPAFFS